MFSSFKEENEFACVRHYSLFHQVQRPDAYTRRILFFCSRYDYSCVIYGWDSFCDMPDNWQDQMGIANLTNGAKQPYYNVLAHDGSTRYAAQGRLVDGVKPLSLTQSKSKIKNQKSSKFH